MRRRVFLPAMIALCGMFSSIFVEMAHAVSRKAERRFERAVELKSEKRLDEALEQYQRALEEEPTYSDALNGIAVIHFARKEYAKAAAFFHRAAQSAEDKDDLLMNWATAAIKAGDEKQAVTPLEQLATGEKHAVRSNTMLSALYMDAGDDDNAIRALLRLSQLQPDNAKVYVNLGNCFFRKQDWEKAESYYKLADMKNKTASGKMKASKEVMAEVKLNMAQIAMERKQFDKAENLAQDAKKLDPRSQEVERVVARANMAQDKPEDAAAALEQAHKMNPDDPRIAWDLARVYTVAGRNDDAIKLYRGMVNSGYKSSREVLGQIANLQEKSGNRAQALETLKPLYDADNPDAKLLNRLVRLARAVDKPIDARNYMAALLNTPEGGTEMAHLELAALQHQGRQTTDAIATLRKGLEAFPESADIPPRLIAYAESANNDDLLIGVLREITAAQPQNVTAQVALGQALLDDNKNRDALRHYQALARQYPADAQVLIGLGMAQQEAGNLEEALSSFQEALRREPQSRMARTSVDQLRRQLDSESADAARGQIETYMAQERYREAVRALLEYKAQKPDDPWATEQETLAKAKLQEAFDAQQKLLAESEKQTQIDDMRSQVVALVKNEDFLDALLVVENLASLNPDDPWVTEQRRSINESLSMQITAELAREDAEEPAPQVAQIATRGVGGAPVADVAPPLGLSYEYWAMALAAAALVFGSGALVMARRRSPEPALAGADGATLEDQRVMSSEKRVSRGMSGDLEQNNISSVVQFIHNEKKTGILTVSSPEHGDGEMRYVNGEIHTAKTGSLRNMDAMFEMLDWNTGDFEFEPREISPKRQLELSVPHILLNFVCAKDEEARDAEDDEEESIQL